MRGVPLMGQAMAAATSHNLRLFKTIENSSDATLLYIAMNQDTVSRIMESRSQKQNLRFLEQGTPMREAEQDNLDCWLLSSSGAVKVLATTSFADCWL